MQSSQGQFEKHLLIRRAGRTVMGVLLAMCLKSCVKTAPIYC